MRDLEVTRWPGGRYKPSQMFPSFAGRYSEPDSRECVTYATSRQPYSKPTCTWISYCRLNKVERSEQEHGDERDSRHHEGASHTIKEEEEEGRETVTPYCDRSITCGTPVLPVQAAVVEEHKQPFEIKMIKTPVPGRGEVRGQSQLSLASHLRRLAE